MKELSIEEKAARYDEAIKVANKYKDTHIMFPQIKDEIFPELAESEDEKVRESLIEYLHTLPNHYAHSGVCAPEWIAWLEKRGEQKPYGQRQECTDCQFNYAGECKGSCTMKRGEQKPADTKFKPGDWVFIEEVKEHKNGPFQIKTVDYFGYSFDEYHTIPFMYKEILSKWTITDAKDGDVLADSEKNIILMFKGIGNTEWDDVIDYHCYYDCHKKSFIIQENVEYWGNREDNQLKPATKEQRNTLMKAMVDAGYTFDFEKKELKKIEKKSSWSEEDERIYKSIIYSFAHNYPLTVQQQEFVKSLESLKDEVRPKQEWSDEDERNLNDAILFIETGTYSLDKDNLINWLKSLRPQNAWKPSDEQMDVLLSEVTAWTKGCPKQIVLESLYQDLKKLREE